MVGLELDRRLEGADGAARIAEIEQRSAEARLRVQRFRVARHGTAEMRGRVFQFSLPSQLRRQVVVGVGELGVELHRRAGTTPVHRPGVLGAGRRCRDCCARRRTSD
jgi:hypothetical protein